MFETMDLFLLLIAAVGTVQAVFLIILLRGEGKRAFRANRWLVVFALMIGMSFVKDILDVMVPASIVPYLAPFFAPLNFAFIPSVYLYFREIAGQPSARPLRHFTLLVPVFMGVAILVWHMNTQPSPISAHPVRIRIYLEREDQFLPNLMLLSMIAAFCMQFAIYMAQIWQVAVGYLRDVGRQFDADKRALRHWLVEFLVEVSLIFTIFTLTNLFDLFVSRNEGILAAVQVGFILIFFRLSHVIASNPALFIQSGDITVNRAENNATQPRAPVDADDADRILARLDRVVADRNLVFNPLLNMPKLANAVGATPNQLSYVLNQHLGKSFFDFINEVRTDEASRLLVDEPDRTILDIATTVGFNSKSTFNLAFKKITGKTPSVYRSETMSQRNTAP